MNPDSPYSWHTPDNPGYRQLAIDVLGFDPWNREHWDTHTAAQSTRHIEATEQDMNERLNAMWFGGLMEGK